MSGKATNNNSKRAQQKKDREEKKLFDDADRVNKRISEKVNELEVCVEKFLDPSLELKKGDFEKEINKWHVPKLKILYGDLMKFLKNPRIKDKTKLQHNKELIESKLKCWSLTEKDNKQLSRTRSSEEVEEEKKRLFKEWLVHSIALLVEQVERLEKDGTKGENKKRKSGCQDTRIKRHEFHIDELYNILGKFETDEHIIDKLESIKDEIDDYIENNEVECYFYNKKMYKDFHASSENLESSDSDVSNEAVSPQTKFAETQGRENRKARKHSRSSKSSDRDLQSASLNRNRRSRNQLERSVSDRLCYPCKQAASDPADDEDISEQLTSSNTIEEDNATSAAKSFVPKCSPVTQSASLGARRRSSSSQEKEPGCSTFVVPHYFAENTYRPVKIDWIPRFSPLGSPRNAIERGKEVNRLQEKRFQSDLDKHKQRQKIKGSQNPSTSEQFQAPRQPVETTCQQKRQSRPSQIEGTPRKQSSEDDRKTEKNSVSLDRGILDSMSENCPTSPANPKNCYIATSQQDVRPAAKEKDPRFASTIIRENSHRVTNKQSLCVSEKGEPDTVSHVHLATASEEKNQSITANDKNNHSAAVNREHVHSTSTCQETAQSAAVMIENGLCTEATLCIHSTANNENNYLSASSDLDQIPMPATNQDSGHTTSFEEVFSAVDPSELSENINGSASANTGNVLSAKENLERNLMGATIPTSTSETNISSETVNHEPPHFTAANQENIPPQTTSADSNALSAITNQEPEPGNLTATNPESIHCGETNKEEVLSADTIHSVATSDVNNQPATDKELKISSEVANQEPVSFTSTNQDNIQSEGEDFQEVIANQEPSNSIESNPKSIESALTGEDLLSLDTKQESRHSTAINYAKVFPEATNETNNDLVAVNEANTILDADMKTADTQKFGGCLELSKKEMEHIKDRRQEMIGQGAFGKVFKGIFKGISVAIKEQSITAPNTEPQFIKEKVFAFLRNLYIVPVLAFSDDQGERLTLIYPLMSKDLKQAFEDGGTLSWDERLRILYQVSEGINFLHTAIEGVRGEIIHGDIKPGNILLDAKNNARLCDAGLAAEIQPDHSHYTATSNYLFGTKGYLDQFEPNKSRKRKENDIFSFGIVGAQLLNWQSAVVIKTTIRLKKEITQEITLFDHLLPVFEIENPTFEQLMNCKDPVFIDKNVWCGSETDVKGIADLIISCVQEIEERPRAYEISTKLIDIMTTSNVSVFNLVDNKCLYCLSNDAEENNTLFSTCCESKKFCSICVGKSFRNPLICPIHGKIKKHFEISSESYAILISGCDILDKETEAGFVKDVNDMYVVVTDPRIIGVPKNNVFRVTAGNKRDIILEHLRTLHGRHPQLLFIYYSGHGADPSTDIPGQQLEPELFIDCDSARNITVTELQEHLKSIHSARLAVILDCCHAGNYDVLPRFTDDTGLKWQIQLNSASGKGFAEISDDKSIFTQHLIAALRSAHHCPLQDMSDEDEVKQEPCKMCEQLRKLSSIRGYIDFNDVRNYIIAHMKEDDSTYAPNMSARNVSGEIQIAHYNDETFVHNFIFSDNDGNKTAFYLDFIDPSMDNLLVKLFKMVSDIGLAPKELDRTVLQLVAHQNAKEYEVDNIYLVNRHVVNRGEAMRFRIRNKGRYLDVNKPVVFLYTSKQDDMEQVLNTFQNIFPNQCKEIKSNNVREVDILLNGLTDLSEFSNDKNCPFKEGEKRGLFDVLLQCLLRAEELTGNLTESKKLNISMSSRTVLVRIKHMRC